LKSFTANNSLTLAGTDGTTMTFSATSATLARTDAANTFTGTQTVGALVATTINGNTFTAGSGVLTLGAGKTHVVSNSLTLAGTDGTTMTFPATSGTVVTSVSVNAVTNAMRAQMAAATLKGNATAALANEADFTIQGLTNLAAPSATLDFVPIYDHVSGTIKNVTPGAVASSSATGVGSYNTRTGAVVAIGTDVPLRGYISGLTTSNDAVAPNTALDIAPGVATSDDATIMISLATAYTKTTSAWAVGSSNGAWDGNGTFPAAGTIHVFLIYRTDTLVADILYSASPTAPTNYNKKRRIWSFKTSGSNILPYTQVGFKCILTAPGVDASSVAVGTSRVVQTLGSLPMGIVVEALLSTYAANASAAASIWIGPLFVADAAPGLSAAPGATIFTGVSTVSLVSGGPLGVLTNVSGQIGMRSSIAGSTVTLFTNGWIDNL
jgi:hypothetical protein